MLERERHGLILRVLRQSRFATVADFAELARSSEATIRRDLDKLEAAGLLRRLRGGAESLQEEQRGPAEPASGLGPQVQLPFADRKGIMREKKRAIARQAAALCEEGDTIIIDGGSTTFHLAEFLQARRLRILTNSFAIAEALIGGSRNTVILAGGIVYPDSQLILDPFQEDAFGNYTASRVFMGAYGVDEQGATNTELLLIKTERAMIERGRELVVLADSSKFGRRGSLLLCGFERIHTLITDSGISEQARNMVLEKGVRLVVV